MKISLIQPSRNNLQYLKWSYASIRKNQGNRHTVEICVLDDASTDGTWEWCLETMEKDPLFKAARNDSGKRWGHTIGYDYLVENLATSAIAMIFHADMYLCPGALDAIEARMLTTEEIEPGVVDVAPNRRKIVSLTRIEPDLHPPGPEKITKNFGTEPEDFDEVEFLDWLDNTGFGEYIYNKFTDPETGFSHEPITDGVFAPWAFWVDDFKSIGGHDPLFAPQSFEDSDIWNRMKLVGFEFEQVWDGFVYHMTCRGSRYNPMLTTPGTNSSEWETQRDKSLRNFLRKWGSPPRHTELLHPIVQEKYDIAFHIEAGRENLYSTISEDWMSTLSLLESLGTVLLDINTIPTAENIRSEYVSKFQDETSYDLGARVLTPSTKLDSGFSIVFYLKSDLFVAELQKLVQYICDQRWLAGFAANYNEGDENVFEMNIISNSTIRIHVTEMPVDLIPRQN